MTVSFESKLHSSLLFLLFDVCTRTLFLLLFAACWKKRERSELESFCDLLFFLRNMDGSRVEEAVVELWNNRTSPNPSPRQPNVEISSSVNLVSVNSVFIIAVGGKQIASPSLNFFLGFEWFGPDIQERHHGGQDVTDRLCSTHKVERLSLVGGLDGHIHQDKAQVEKQPSATVQPASLQTNKWSSSICHPQPEW